MPRVNERRVAHKSTGGIPPKISTPVGPVGNAPNHLTPNTVALSANESLSPGLIRVLCTKAVRLSPGRLPTSIPMGSAKKKWQPRPITQRTVVVSTTPWAA
jgi:hypothetical protein